uniref:Mitochondrial inner membrane protease subunit 2 n=1 Tax=Meleagris gallopavo TaxID=9103 RepID=A0A803Y4T5_MELGA
VLYMIKWMSLIIVFVCGSFFSICFLVMACNENDCSSFTSKIIKRVIALEGDIIKTIGYKKKYVKVPHGHIWVEGDHHGHSFDSNAFGPVSLGLLHARATHILWPPKRWQKLQPMLPPERKPLQREQE